MIVIPSMAMDFPDGQQRFNWCNCQSKAALRSGMAGLGDVSLPFPEFASDPVPVDANGFPEFSSDPSAPNYVDMSVAPPSPFLVPVTTPINFGASTPAPAKTPIFDFSYWAKALTGGGTPTKLPAAASSAPWYAAGPGGSISPTLIIGGLAVVAAVLVLGAKGGRR